MKKIIALCVLFMAVFAFATELFTAANQKNWKFADSKLTVPADGAALKVNFDQKTHFSVNQLKIEQNKFYVIAVKGTLSKGATMRFYVQNNTKGVWQNAVVNDKGSGVEKDYYMPFKFVKPFKGNVYVRFEPKCKDGAGFFEIKSLKLLEAPSDSLIVNGDFSNGSAAWYLGNGAKVVKNAAGENVLELFAEKAKSTVKVKSVNIPVTAGKTYRLSYSNDCASGFGRKTLEHDFRVYPAVNNKAISGTDKWETKHHGRILKFEQEFKAPSGAKNITVNVEVRDEAKVQFFDFKLEELADKTTAPATAPTVKIFSKNEINLLDKKNHDMWNGMKNAKFTADGISAKFTKSTSFGISGLPIKDNVYYVMKVTAKAAKGTSVFFYVENNTKGVWQNKSLRFNGTGNFETRFMAFKFPKKIASNVYAKFRLSTKGTPEGAFELKELTLFQNDNPATFFNADLNDGVVGWDLNNTGKIVKNKDGKNAVELAVREDGKIVRFFSAPVEVVPLKHYRLSYDVFSFRGEGKASIEHDIRMYPIARNQVPMAGTEKWQVGLDGRTQKKYVEFRPPRNCKDVMFAIEARGPAKVQINNFKLEEFTPVVKLAEILLDQPFNFRDGVFSTNKAEKITGVIDFKEKNLTAELVFNDNGKAIFSKKCTPADNKFSLPVPAQGKSFELVMTAKDAAGKTVCTEKKTINNYAPNPVEVTFRDDGVTLVNGKPFFHIGNWWYTNRGDIDEDLEFLKEAGFNVIFLHHNHPQSKNSDRFPLLDMVHRHGLWGIVELPHKYSVTMNDKQRAAFKNKWVNLIKKYQKHPALFGYFGPDEAMIQGYTVETISEFYHWAKDNDPYHPLWYNEAPVGTVAEHQAYANDTCDVFGVDIYPIGAPHGVDLGDRTLTVIGKHTDRSMQAVKYRKPVWMIIQGFSWAHMRRPAKFQPADEAMRKTYPDYPQTRFAAFNAILHGATGLQFHYLGYTVYVPDEFWDAVRKTTLELKYLTPVLTARTVKNPAVKCNNPKVNMMVKNLDGKFYYILANESGDSISAKFTGFTEKQLNVIFDSNPVKVNNGAFELKLEPYAVRVMSAEKFDAPEKIWQIKTYRPWSAKIKNDVRK